MKSKPTIKEKELILMQDLSNLFKHLSIKELAMLKIALSLAKNTDENINKKIK